MDRHIRAPLAGLCSVRGLEIGFVLSLMMVVATLLPDHEVGRFLFASTAGLVTFLAVEILGHVLDKRGQAMNVAAKGGDWAHSFTLKCLMPHSVLTGVIGAFALTHNLFLIAIGLGIGAMYVRAMTIMLVERQTLAEFRYLEHGAFWSILILSVIMFGQTLYHINEMVTGLLGASFIGLALISSLIYRRNNPEC